MITMTTVWLLLLVVIATSQVVHNQSTTDDETCSDGQLLNVIERLLHNQQTILSRLGMYNNYRGCPGCQNHFPTTAI